MPTAYTVLLRLALPLNLRSTEPSPLSRAMRFLGSWLTKVKFPPMAMLLSELPAP